MTETLSTKIKRLSNDLAKVAYKLTFDFPKVEQYALGDQIRRSLLSVPSNIYEGTSRENNKDKKRFLNIAYSSLSEFRYQIFFAYQMKYIKKESYSEIKKKADEISKLLYVFIEKLKN